MIQKMLVHIESPNVDGSSSFPSSFHRHERCTCQSHTLHWPSLRSALDISSLDVRPWEIEDERAACLWCARGAADQGSYATSERLLRRGPRKHYASSPGPAGTVGAWRHTPNGLGHTHPVYVLPTAAFWMLHTLKPRRSLARHKHSTTII
jgi:hypothetical protein